FVPLVGARTPAQVASMVKALERPLSSAEVAELEALVPVGAAAGTRYAEAQMAHLDSEG
ncbi:MAG: aldo/keto reductase, partial [Myxococcales bacterium]|nr:aldo/keto reductase [Myxococcales bacterium]